MDAGHLVLMLSDVCERTQNAAGDVFASSLLSAEGWVLIIFRVNLWSDRFRTVTSRWKTVTTATIQVIAISDGRLIYVSRDRPVALHSVLA